MDFTTLYLCFLLSCGIISICFTKRQMKTARAVFLAIGGYVAVVSAVLMFLDSSFNAMLAERMHLDKITTYLLGISTVFFTLVSVVVFFGTLVLSLIAVHKIAERIKSGRVKLDRTPKFVLLPSEANYFSTKFFRLYCRWLN